MKKKPDKLSQEVSMALAAGMSYGKWKAMQTPTVIEKPKPKARAMQVCEHCGSEFPVFDNRKRRYCSDMCRVAQNYERKQYGKSENARSE